MPISFVLAPGECRKLTVKKIGRGKALKKPTGILSLQVRLPVSVLSAIDQDLPDQLFIGKRVHFPNLAPLRWEGEIEHMRLDVGGIVLQDVKVTKLSFAPYVLDDEPRIKLDFQAQFESKENLIALLLELVDTDVNISLESGDLFAEKSA